MAHRRRFRSSFRGGTRRKKTWVQALIQSGGANNTLLPLIQVPVIAPVANDSYARIVDVMLPGSPGDNGIPTESTVLRIRGQLQITKSLLTAGNVTDMFGFGICVMDLPNFPGDTDDLPGPMSAPEWDGWMFLRGPSEQASVDVQSTIFDVKAMRKVEGGQRLCFVTEVYDDNAASPIVQSPATYSARVLLALP